MQGLWRMSGLEHHKTDRRYGEDVQHAQAVCGRHELGRKNSSGNYTLTHFAIQRMNQYQQQIIVSQGFIRAIQTGHRLNRIKSKTL